MRGRRFTGGNCWRMRARPSPSDPPPVSLKLAAEMALGPRRQHHPVTYLATHGRMKVARSMPKHGSRGCHVVRRVSALDCIFRIRIMAPLRRGGGGGGRPRDSPSAKNGGAVGTVA